MEVNKHFFLKKNAQTFVGLKKYLYLCTAFRK